MPKKGKKDPKKAVRNQTLSASHSMPASAARLERHTVLLARNQIPPGAR
jgi:hypothetical protein